MPPGVWIRYLLGQGRAIEEVAGNWNAFWTGLALVLLTAIARSYDQMFIGEKPLLWLLGPLMFSFVSGSWLYVIVYGSFVRRGMSVWSVERMSASITRGCRLPTESRAE